MIKIIINGLALQTMQKLQRLRYKNMDWRMKTDLCLMLRINIYKIPDFTPR